MNGMIDICFCHFNGQTRRVLAAWPHHVLSHTGLDLDAPNYEYHISISKHIYENCDNENISINVILCILCKNDRNH